MSPLPIFRKWMVWYPPSLRSSRLGAAWVGATCFLFCAGQTAVFAQNYLTQGGEYAPAGGLPGDQTAPHAAIKSSGGYIVWQDNATDGFGLGISARKLDGSLSGSLSPFRVNEAGAGDQEKPQAALLNDGGAAFVWQGGRQGFQDIYARFLSSAGTWATGDVLVNTVTNDSQLNPAVTTLTNGTVVVAWGSFNQASSNSMQDVYAQRFTPVGAKVGGEFLVNQTTTFNQRTPSIAPLADGRLVAVWVSEQQRAVFTETQRGSVDIYGRFFDANGSALGAEFLVSTGTNVCANPSVAASPGGGFAVAWGEKDIIVRSNSWDIYARVFSSAGVGGTTRRINTRIYGDQIAPKIAARDTDFLAVWTSLAQDGSFEGVYGQFLDATGALSGSELRVNTTTVSKQIHPTVVSDGGGRFLALWTSFTSGVNSFDLMAQRYATVLEPLSPLDAPFVTVLSSNALSVSWPVLQGFSVSNYEVYADGTVTATAVVTNNWWTMTGLPSSSTHCFRVAYVLADGRVSPLSGSTCNTTYGALVYGGIPYEWMVYYFGGDIFNWPSPFADTDGDGVSNRDEFFHGTDPGDADSVLKQRTRRSPQGLFLDWNTQPGLIYQVQMTTAHDFNGDSWTNVGLPRFAAGNVDSINLGFVSGPRGFYRIVRLR